MEGLAAKLNTDLREGIKESSIDARVATFGTNKMPSLPPKSFWSMVAENLQDPTLILLMMAATVSRGMHASSHRSVTECAARPKAYSSYYMFL